MILTVLGLLPEMGALVEATPLIPLVVPRWMQQMSHELHPLLESGILLTSIAAVVLDLFFNGAKGATAGAIEAAKTAEAHCGGFAIKRKWTPTHGALSPIMVAGPNARGRLAAGARLSRLLPFNARVEPSTTACRGLSARTRGSASPGHRYTAGSVPLPACHRLTTCRSSRRTW